MNRVPRNLGTLLILKGDEIVATSDAKLDDADVFTSLCYPYQSKWYRLTINKITLQIRWIKEAGRHQAVTVRG